MTAVGQVKHAVAAAIKAAGKLKQEGRNYVVQDGDVIFFKFNLGSEGKKK